MAKKPTEKATPKGLPAHLQPGNPGNSGGKPGRSGRKTIGFYERCEGLTDQYVIVEAEKVLRAGHAHPDFKWAAEYVSKYSRSPAPVRQDVTIRDLSSISDEELQKLRKQLGGGA